MTEAEFLASYNIHDFDVPLTTVDSVLFTVSAGELKVLLVKRANYPDKGKWGLPGGFVDIHRDQTIQACANRNLAAKTGILPPYLEQLCSRGNASRDKRGWSVSVCYYALIAYEKCHSHIATVEEAAWHSLNRILDDKQQLAFDHGEIVIEAWQRLQQKALYSLIPAFALPDSFTLSELQTVHEIILDKEIQKKSFRRRIEQSQVLEETGEMRAEVGRPAKLYKVKPEAANHRFLRNLEF